MFTGPIIKDTLPDKENHSPSTSPAHLNETSELVPHDQSDKGQLNEEVRTDACRPIPILSPHLSKTEKSSTGNDNMDDDDMPGLVSEDEMRADLSEPNHVPPKLFRKGKQPARPLNGESLFPSLVDTFLDHGVDGLLTNQIYDNLQSTLTFFSHPLIVYNSICSSYIATRTDVFPFDRYIHHTRTACLRESHSSLRCLSIPHALWLSFGHCNETLTVPLQSITEPDVFR